MAKEIDAEQLMTAVKEVVLKANKEHKEMVLQNMTEICDQIVKRILQQELKITFHNNEVKRRNVVVYGVSEELEESWEQILTKVISILNMVMKMNIERNEIDYCCRLGKRNHKFPGRPVLIKFTTEWRKIDMLRRRNSLKGRKLFVDEDHTKEIMEKRKQLIPKMMELRKEGKFVILRRDKIIVNGIEWTEPSNERECKSEETNVKTKKVDKDGSKPKTKKNGKSKYRKK